MLLQSMRYWNRSTFGHLKHQRRIATHYEKTALSFASFLKLHG